MLGQLQCYITAAASETGRVVHAQEQVWAEHLDRLCGPVCVRPGVSAKENCPPNATYESMWGKSKQSGVRPWKKDHAKRESVAQVLEKLSFDDEGTRGVTSHTTDSTKRESAEKESARSSLNESLHLVSGRLDLENQPTIKKLMETLEKYKKDHDLDEVSLSDLKKLDESLDLQEPMADDQEFTRERLRLQMLAREAIKERTRRIHEKSVNLSAAELFELEIQRAEEEEARRQAELDAMTPAERELAEGKRRAEEAMARLNAERKALQEREELEQLDGEEYRYTKVEEDNLLQTEPEYAMHRTASLEVVDEDPYDEGNTDNWEPLASERVSEERSSFKHSSYEEMESQKQDTVSTSEETQGVSIGPHVGVDHSEVTSPLTMKGAISPSSSQQITRGEGLPPIPANLGRHLSFDQISLCGSDTVSNFSTDSGSNVMQKKKKKKISDLICRDLVCSDPSVIVASLSTLAEKAVDAKDRASIVRFGGILGIVQTMERHTEKAAIQIAACLALERLALDTENELAIGEVKGVEAILGAMMAHFTDTHVQEAAWSALCNCACGNACETMTIDTQGGMAALVSCMKQHVANPKVVASAMNTFTNLCLNNEVRMKALATSDGFGAIAMALQRHWNTPTIRNEASYTMNVLLQRNASKHAKVISGETVEEHEEVIEDEESVEEEYVFEEEYVEEEYH